MCSGGVPETVGGNEDADCRLSTNTSGMQVANLGVSATEVLIQEGLEVLLVVFFHLLRPLQ